MSRPAITVNGRSYQWMRQPLVVVCVDGCEYDYLSAARDHGEIERRGEAAFSLLRDRKGPFVVKDTYVFVTDMNAVELVNPAFPNLEGRDLLELKDTHGKYLNKELLEVVKTRGSGWADYLWPKPGESVSTQKSTYVSRAKLADKSVMVGCGVYLADAPTETLTKMTAPALMTLVREGAAILQERGEKAYPDFRKQGAGSSPP